ncbi:transcriptional regulator, ArsR family [Geomicrobium sp. JCM 19039]|nr:transcriptional regulator, ArsR family [Geomicrobium sp. JCM 19039]
MKDVFIMTKYAQLKAVSDPFRGHLLTHFGIEPITGQQLAEKLDLSRSKIHYHLNELEKNGIIHIVKREEKNGILQKFYQPVASSFLVDEQLLNFVEGSGGEKSGFKSASFRGDDEARQKFLTHVSDAIDEGRKRYAKDEGETFTISMSWTPKS